MAAWCATTVVVALTAVAGSPGRASADPEPRPVLLRTVQAAAAKAKAMGRGTAAAQAELEDAGAPAVVAGGAHTCALTLGVFSDDTSLWCWGGNGAGQLGIGGTAAESLVPVRVNAVAPLAGVDLIGADAGAAHTCAAAVGGALYCWGSNAQGQLGTGGPGEERRPVPVPGVTDVAAVATGQEHTCAVTDVGSVWCWGRNDAGQLGTGSLAASAGTPQPVGGLVGITGIAAHEHNTCVVDAGGDAWCWGSDADGQLGDAGAATTSRVPVQVDESGIGDPFLDQVDVGRRHACAVDDEGAAYCWGDDSAGQLGDGGAATDSPMPVPVAAGERLFVRVDAGDDTTCGLEIFVVSCWGDNTRGRLGTGDVANRETPAGIANGEMRPTPFLGPLFGLASALLIGVDTSGGHTCAVEILGSVYCWGANDAGQLGDRTRVDNAAPVRTSLSPDPVTGVRLAARDRALAVSWQAPADPGATPVVAYAALALADTGEGCGTFGARSCVIPGLVNGTRYPVFVLAGTVAGISISDVAYGTPTGGGAGAGLPITGSPLRAQSAVAVALLIIGAVGLWTARRRRIRFTA